jgi:hypothetical protein
MKKFIIDIIKKWLQKQGYDISQNARHSLGAPPLNKAPIPKKNKGENMQTSFLFGLYKNRTEHVTRNAIIMEVIRYVFFIVVILYLPTIIRFLELLITNFKKLYLHP